MGFYCPSSFISAVCLRWYLSRKYDETLRVVPWCETRRAACLNSRLPERAEDKLPSSLRSCDIKQRGGLEFGKTVLCTGWNWLNSCVYIDPNNPLITRINTQSTETDPIRPDLNEFPERLRGQSRVIISTEFIWCVEHCGVCLLASQQLSARLLCCCSASLTSSQTCGLLIVRLAKVIIQSIDKRNSNLWYSDQ